MKCELEFGRAVLGKQVFWIVQKPSHFQGNDYVSIQLIVLEKLLQCFKFPEKPSNSLKKQDSLSV